MVYVLAVFRSRSQTLDFVSRLKLYHISATAVNTPKEANVGCGLSARFPESAMQAAQRVRAMRYYDSFVGYLRTDGNGYRNYGY